MKWLTQLVLVTKCFAYAPFRGFARRVPEAPKRIGVLQLAKLGDMVCTTPMFATIKRAYPSAKVVVIGNSINREVLAGHPHVDEYVVWGTESLKDLKLDVICITAPNTEMLAAAYLSGIPAIICPRIEDGWSPYETRSYRFLRRLCITVPHRMNHYAPREYLRLLEPLGIVSDDTRKELSVSARAEEAANKSLEPYQQKIKVAIAPGAGNKIKEWPPERFNEIARYLIEEKGALVLLIGGPADTELAKIVAKELPSGSALDTTGQVSVEELKGLIKHMDLFVSADTGPIYIAEAFGVPTIDIVGPMDEREQPPVGSQHKVVVSSRRREPQLHIMNARVYNTEEAQKQVTDITASQVIREIEALLPNI